jgi:hypothetical protein
MKLVQIIEAKEVAPTVLESLKSFQASFAITRLSEELTLPYNEYLKQRNSLIDKYGREPDKDNPLEAQYEGKFIPQDSEEFKLFREELTKLLNEDVDITFKKLKTDHFKDEHLAGNHVASLYPFFDAT